MDIYILIKAVQKGTSLELKCLGAFTLAHKAREAMCKDYDATRNETDFDRDAPDQTADTAWIVADDDTLTMWNVQHTTLTAAPMADGVREVPL